ncbi:hypothetical protein Phpb_01416 [Photorhabdus namnaonensis]|uniref:Uncharacterized protein n=1 Tax=Photorhabdus namnaonensis TaxID=1851568 RepID=A0A1B8YKH8_9GAMM|nr:hypothetical protein Phpb_01416 [Photorhabdus namnaonensis]
MFANPIVLSCAPYHILEQQIPFSTDKLWKRLANYLIDPLEKTNSINAKMMRNIVTGYALLLLPD